MFPKIETRAEGLKLARQGAVCAMILMGSQGLGAALTFYRDVSVLDGSDLTQRDRLGMAVGSGVMLPVEAFVVWRMWRGSGYVSTTLMFLLFLYEVSWKIIGGNVGAVWIIAYVGLTIGFVNVIRATWAGPRIPDATAFE